MGLSADPLFGPCYLSPKEFRQNAGLFGVTLTDAVCNDLLAYLSAASQWIDAYTSRSFLPDTDLTEQHKFNHETRRINVNCPPVASVSDYRVYVGVNSFVAMQPAGLYINNQENWIELSILTVSELVASPMMQLGLYEPIVQVTYRSSATLRPNIKLATGYVAAALISHAVVNQSIPVGVQSIRLGSTLAISRTSTGVNRSTGEPTIPIPDIVKTLLTADVPIGIA